MQMKQVKVHALNALKGITVQPQNSFHATQVIMLMQGPHHARLALRDIPVQEEHCPADACKGLTRPMGAAPVNRVTKAAIVQTMEWNSPCRVSADGSQVLLEKPHVKNALKGIIVIARLRYLVTLVTTAMLVHILAIHVLVVIPAPEEHCLLNVCKGLIQPMAAAPVNHVTREVTVHMTEWKNRYRVTTGGLQVLQEKQLAKNAQLDFIAIPRQRFPVNLATIVSRVPSHVTLAPEDSRAQEEPNPWNAERVITPPTAVRLASFATRDSIVRTMALQRSLHVPKVIIMHDCFEAPSLSEISRTTLPHGIMLQLASHVMLILLIHLVSSLSYIAFQAQ